MVLILLSLQNRYPNRPIIEFEIAAQEQMKITELRLAKLFSSKAKDTIDQYPAVVAKKVEGTYFSFCFRTTFSISEKGIYLVKLLNLRFRCCFTPTDTFSEENTL